MEDNFKNDHDFPFDLTTIEPKIKPKFDNVVAEENKIDSITKKEIKNADLDSEISFKNHIKLHKEVLGLQHNELEFSTQGIVLNKIESELEKMSSASMKPKIENVVLPAPGATMKICKNDSSAKSEVQSILENQDISKLELLLEVSTAKQEFLKITSSTIIRHKQIHTDEKPFPCNFCVKKFASRKAMKRHEIIHSKIEDMVKNEAQSNQARIQEENSDQSENSAKRENSAKKENPAQIASGKVPCGLCGKQLSKKSMKVHERLHTGKNPYKCKFCKKAFKQKSHANKHELTHAGENQIIPEARIQDENSATRENSTQSENSAKSENSAQSENSAKTENSAPIASGKISCGLCGKQIYKTSMKFHERVHTGEKPYECKFCKKAFKQKAHVKRHELTHTGENKKIPATGVQGENSAQSENSAQTSSPIEFKAKENIQHKAQTPKEYERVSGHDNPEILGNKQFEAESKTESKAEFEAESKTESNAESEAESKTESKAESEDELTEFDYESKVEYEDESDTESEAESKAESKTESKDESEEESKTESDAESEAESKAESEDESKDESDAESDTESEAEFEAESKAESEDETEDESKYSHLVNGSKRIHTGEKPFAAGFFKQFKSK